MMSNMNDDEMTAEEFDRRQAASDPVTLNVNIRRPQAYKVTLVTKVGWTAPRHHGREMRVTTGVAPATASA